MLCHISLNKGAQIPLHNHPPVQIGMCVSGKIRFFGQKTPKMSSPVPPVTATSWKVTNLMALTPSKTPSSSRCLVHHALNTRISRLADCCRVPI